jgi:hypothetical protein
MRTVTMHDDESLVPLHESKEPENSNIICDSLKLFMSCLVIVSQGKEDAATMNSVLTQLQRHFGGLTRPTADECLLQCQHDSKHFQRLLSSDSSWNSPFSLPPPPAWVGHFSQTSRAEPSLSGEMIIETFLTGLTSPDEWLYSGQTRCALCCLSALLNVSPQAFLLIESKWSNRQGEEARRALAQSRVSSDDQQSSTSGLNAEGSAKEGGAEEDTADDWAGFALGTAAAVAGGGLIILTAGLAAPVLAAIGATFMGAIPVAGPIIAPVVTSSVGVAAITGGLTFYGAHAASSVTMELLGSVEQYGFLDLDEMKEEEAWEKLPDLEAILMHHHDPDDSASTAVKQEGAAAIAASNKEEDLVLPVLPLNLLPSPQKSTSLALKLAICVSGFVSASSSSELCQPWSPALASHSTSCDRFVLLFDVQILRAVAWTESQFAKEEAVSGVVTMATLAIPALWPIGLLGMVRGLSSPWMTALKRAKAAGIMLGRQLAQLQEARSRPTTLLGFSLGARVVFFALVELSRLGVRGAVESAVLMGAPVEVDDAQAEEWQAARSVVVGRLVNAFSPSDLTLSLIHRCKTFDVVSVIAGLSPVHVNGIENSDISDLINTHEDYETKLPMILERLGFC